MVTYKTDIDDRGRPHKEYTCLSTDVTKFNASGVEYYKISDTTEAKNADTAYAMDTGEIYLYDEENARWLKQ